MVSRIEVRGARVHNLRNVDVDITLNKIVGGRLRVRQIVARARRPLHRGLAALP